jgi:hypothetical protein
MFGKNSQIHNTIHNTIHNSINKIENNPTMFALIVVIEFIIFILIAYRWNPYGISDKYPAQVALFFLIIMFIQSVNYFFIKQKAALNKSGDGDTPGLVKFTIKLFSTLAAFAGIICLLIGTWWLLRHIPSMPTIHTIIIWTLNILIGSGILGFVYLLAKRLILRQKKSENNSNSIVSLIGNLILYIPCLLIQFADYLKHQFNITTETTWIILLLELVFVGLRFLIPEIWRRIVTHDGIHLLKEPVFLNKEYTLGNYENLHSKNDSKDGKFKYNYSLSAWFYLNPQPPNTNSAYTKYTNILNYGQKPLVQYNGKLNSLRIQTEIDDGDLVTVYETNDIKYQKWNNIVVNYDGGNMDIFINGEIVATRKNVAPYMTYENVTAGSNNGIYGGICNVVYYNRVLSRSIISLVYKSLREKQFPTL